jgi:ribosomal protein S18 acetylase RimI-like enzyme
MYNSPLQPVQAYDDTQDNVVKIILPSSVKTIKAIRRNTFNTYTKSLTFRRVQECDIPALVRIYVREWGPSNRYHNPHVIRFFIPNQLFPSTISSSSVATLDLSKTFLPLSDIVDYCDNFLLACCFYLGIYQRLQSPRWMISELDHQWWCLVSNELENYEILGAAEFSLQPPGMSSTALAIPMKLKNILWGGGEGGQYDDDDFSHGFEPYISNVIIRKESRGYGYGHTMMSCLEQVAIAYGFSSVALHVDAVASPAALSLYSKLGFLEELTPLSVPKGQQVGHQFLLRTLFILVDRCTKALRLDPKLTFMKKEMDSSNSPSDLSHDILGDFDAALSMDLGSLAT